MSNSNGKVNLKDHMEKLVAEELSTITLKKSSDEKLAKIAAIYTQDKVLLLESFIDFLYTSACEIGDIKDSTYDIFAAVGKTQYLNYLLKTCVTLTNVELEHDPTKEHDFAFYKKNKKDHPDDFNEAFYIFEVKLTKLLEDAKNKILNDLWGEINVKK